MKAIRSLRNKIATLPWKDDLQIRGHRFKVGSISTVGCFPPATFSWTSHEEYLLYTPFLSDFIQTHDLAQICISSPNSNLNSRLGYPTTSLTHALDCLIDSLPSFLSNLSLFSKWQVILPVAEAKNYGVILEFSFSHTSPSIHISHSRSDFKIYPQSNHFLLIALVSPILSHLDNL